MSSTQPGGDTAYPAHSIRYGNVNLAIWRNDSGFHNVTVERRYKLGDEWRSSASFGRDDLPKLEAGLRDAYRWIFDNAGSQPPADYEHGEP